MLRWGVGKGTRNPVFEKGEEWAIAKYYDNVLIVTGLVRLQVYIPW